MVIIWTLINTGTPIRGLSASEGSYRNPDNSARRIRFHGTRRQRAIAATFC